MKRLIPLLFLAVAALVACETDIQTDGQVGQDTAEGTTAAGQATGAEDPAAARQAIEQVNRQFVERYNQGDLEGFVEVYTDDAKLYPPGQPVVEGREAITGFWQAGRDQMGIRDVSLTTNELEVMGDRAWEVGTANYTTNQGPVESRYMVIWERTPQGEWRWHRDMMSPGAGGATESAGGATGSAGA